MKISVAIPCFNGEKFVAATIESVLAQSRPADEILVIDDGSTDNSREIIQRYPVTAISHPHNLGLSTARNTAIERAQSDIIAYMDVDALADKNWLETLAKHYTNSNVSGVGGIGIESNIKSIADQWRCKHATQGHGPDRRNRVEFLFGLNMSFRRSALLQVGGFDTQLRSNAEDMDIGFRLHDRGGQLFYDPAARVYHQRSDTIPSLCKTMYNWYYWAFIVRRKNGRNPWKLALGTIRRTLHSVFLFSPYQRNGLALLQLDLQIAAQKYHAILDAARAVAAGKVNVI